MFEFYCENQNLSIFDFVKKFTDINPEYKVDVGKEKPLYLRISRVHHVIKNLKKKRANNRTSAAKYEESFKEIFPVESKPRKAADQSGPSTLVTENSEDNKRVKDLELVIQALQDENTALKRECPEYKEGFETTLIEFSEAVDEFESVESEAKAKFEEVKKAQNQEEITQLKKQLEQLQEKYNIKDQKLK